MIFKAKFVEAVVLVASIEVRKKVRCWQRLLNSSDSLDVVSGLDLDDERISLIISLKVEGFRFWFSLNLIKNDIS